MNNTESKIINDFADSYLSKLIDRIIAQLDKSPNDAVEKKISSCFGKHPGGNLRSAAR